MISDANRASIPLPLRAVLCLSLCVGACLAAAGAISASRVSGHGGSASPKDNGKQIADSSAVALAKAEGANKIAPWVVEHTANGQQAEFLVVLADQANLSGSATLCTKTEKGRYVYDALWNKTKATQEPILQWLRERGIEHRSF